MADGYKEKARALKKLGFIDYSLKGEFSKGEKANISRLANKHRAVIENPENFVQRTINKKALKKMRADGYSTTEKKVFISRETYKEVHVKSRKKKDGKVDILITRKTGNKTQKTRVYTDDELLKALEKVDKKTLPKNTFITVRIGKNGAFNRVFRSAEELNNYVTNKFKPKHGADRDELINQMSIVKYEGMTREQLGAFRTKQKRGSKNVRRKKK